MSDFRRCRDLGARSCHTRRFVRYDRDILDDFAASRSTKPTYPALEVAMGSHCYSADGVKQLLRHLSEQPHTPDPLTAQQLPVPDVGPVQWPELRQFDRLLATVAGGGS